VAHRLLLLWRRLSPLPGGQWLFSWILKRAVPYSGTVYPRVLVLEPGHARIEILDRHSIRNHLDSIHAIALANVGELASGLAMSAALPREVRGIVSAIRIEYFKKARGTLVAESRCTVPPVTGDTDHDVVADVADSDGNVVARATVTWRLGLARTK
jgi:acyl-coenzyme A thioesterase PaaI-like protein